MAPPGAWVSPALILEMILTGNFRLYNPLRMRLPADSDALPLTPADGPAVEILNPRGEGPMLLVCEHASSRIPEALGDLGLHSEARESHVAWDPGALAVARHLAEAFDAPLVAAGFSRLVHDCNRPAASPEAMPARSEAFAIPGNAALGPAARAARAAAIHAPFHAAIAAALEARPRPLVTVHSFTPVYFGTRRETELGILHDADARLAEAMLTFGTGLRMARNDPYGPEDGVTHTLRLHALPRCLPNVMIEIRSDLIGDAQAQARMAGILAAMLGHGLAALERP